MGTEYRSIILCEDEEQLDIAQASRDAQQVNSIHVARPAELSLWCAVM